MSARDYERGAAILALLLCPLLIFAAENATGSGFPFPWKNGRLWGYVDGRGKWVIAPRFSSAKNFDATGLAEVSVLVKAEGAESEKNGTIDSNGDWVVRPDWADIKFSKENSLFVKKGKEWFLADRGGRLLRTEGLRDVLPFSEGMALAWNGGFFGYIDAAGKWAIRPSFDGGDNFSSGLAPAKSGSRWGYIDKRGKWFISARFEKAGPFADGVARVKSEGKWGLLEKDSTWILEPSHEEIDQASEGLWPVRVGKSWGFLDSRGRMAIGPRFAKASEFHSGRAREKDPATGLWGYIGPDGAWIIAPNYDKAEDFCDGLARVRSQKGDWLLLDSKGAEIAVAAFEED